MSICSVLCDYGYFFYVTKKLNKLGEAESEANRVLYFAFFIACCVVHSLQLSVIFFHTMYVCIEVCTC